MKDRTVEKESSVNVRTSMQNDKTDQKLAKLVLNLEAADFGPSYALCRVSDDDACFHSCTRTREKCNICKHIETF